GRHERGSFFPYDPAGDLFPVFSAQPIVEYDAGAVTSRGSDLRRRSVLGHHDGGPDPQLPCRQRHRLRMVARGKGNHSAGAFRGREQRQPRECTPGLEGPDFLEDLALEEDLRAYGLVDQPRGQNRRAVHVRTDAFLGRQNVSQGDRERRGDEHEALYSIRQGGASGLLPFDEDTVVLLVEAGEADRDQDMASAGAEMMLLRELILRFG